MHIITTQSYIIYLLRLQQIDTLLLTLFILISFILSFYYDIYLDIHRFIQQYQFIHKIEGGPMVTIKF